MCAYMSQEHKKEFAPVIQAICKKYNIKASIAVQHHSGLVLNIKSGPIDFLKQYNKRVEEQCATNKLRGFGFCEYVPAKYVDVNEYYIDKWTDKAGEFLKEVHAAMNVGNHDRSDTMTDYFDVGWYTYINIGQWNKPYILV